MNQLFDNLGEQLNDMIGDHSNNNVGYAMSKVFPKGYAEGGAVGDEGDSGVAKAIRSTAQAANKTLTGGSEYGSGKSVGDVFTNSAPYIASHYTELGKFFKGTEPGNFYTNRYKEPTPGKPSEAVDPSVFYSRWYEGIRRFAEAEEVANRGQVTTRTR